MNVENGHKNTDPAPWLAQGIATVFKSLYLQYSTVGRRKYDIMMYSILPIRVPEKKHDKQSEYPCRNRQKDKADIKKKQGEAQACENKGEAFPGKGPLVIDARIFQYLPGSLHVLDVQLVWV